ncbi:hypothetical protein FICEBENF_02847 [Aeromonas hydrophila]
MSRQRGKRMQHSFEPARHHHTASPLKQLTDRPGLPASAVAGLLRRSPNSLCSPFLANHMTQTVVTANNKQPGLSRVVWVPANAGSGCGALPGAQQHYAKRKRPMV